MKYKHQKNARPNATTRKTVPGTQQLGIPPASTRLKIASCSKAEASLWSSQASPQATGLQCMNRKSWSNYHSIASTMVPRVTHFLKVIGKRENCNKVLYANTFYHTPQPLATAFLIQLRIPYPAVNLDVFLCLNQIIFWSKKIFLRMVQCSKKFNMKI